MEHDKTNILSLPREIFESIAERVPEQDLPSLRLACRDISRKTHRTFVNTHFTHKCFLLDSPSSIKAAVKIAQHLSFGPALRNLTFVIDQIPDIRTMPPPRSHTEANHRKRLKTVSQLREQLWNDDQPFRNATVQKRVLTGLFDLLKDHGSLTTIHFAQAFMADRQPVFNDKSVFKLKDPELDYTEDDILNERLEPESAIQMVLEAINRSGITSIQGIHMDNIGAIILDRMSPTTIKIYETAFRSLKSLSLSVVKLSFYCGHEASQEDVRDFCKAVTQSPTLEYLSLNMGRDHEDPF